MSGPTLSATKGAVLWLALVAALFAAGARAQPLSELAPGDALLVLEYQRPPELDDDLMGRLAELDWAAAGATLRDLAGLAGDDLDEAFEVPPFRLLGAVAGLEDFGSELAEECPAFPADAHPLQVVDEAIATFGMNAMSPFPVVTSVVRVSSDASDVAARMHDALVECFGSDRTTQGGTTIDILGQGSDLPVAVARMGDVYIAATSPDAVRAALRRSAGDEPALAQTRLWQATERFEGTGVGFGLDVAGVARLVEVFIGAPNAQDPTERYVLERLLAVGRTVGGVALRASAHPDGLLFESAVAVDPDGGDPELASLLLCSACGVDRPFLVPSGADGITSQHLPLREFVSYVDDWLAGIAEAGGDELDLRTIWSEVLGVDLDEALLDWVGTQVHVVTLAPFQPTLRQLVYQQPTALVMPVASPEAAARGMELLGEAFGPLFADILSGAAPILDRGGMLGSMDFGPDPGPSGLDMLASREASYRDIPYRRIQVGPTLDVAVALVGNHLVVASPSIALRPIVDTFHGDLPPAGGDAYRRAREAAPAGAFAIAHDDVGADLAGLAELGHVLAQPVASIASTVLAVTPVSRESTPSGSDPVPAREVALDAFPTRIEGRLGTGPANEFGGYVDRFRLTGIPAGQPVRVTLESDAFDAYLYLLDAAGMEMAQNDDNGFGTDSTITFVADGGEYLVDASSFGGGSTGPYVLTIEEGDLSSLPQVDTSGVTPRTVSAGTSVTDSLTDDDQLPGGMIGAYYALEGVPPGQRVIVELTSNAFDTYLRVVDPDSGALLAENDDAPDTRRSAVTIGATGRPLWVQVTSWSGNAAGPFSLTVEVEQTPAVVQEPERAEPERAEPEPDEPAGRPATPPENAASEAVEPPAFAEMLHLVEIVPYTLDILSEHVGLSLGYGHIDGDTVYRRTLIEIDW